MLTLLGGALAAQELPGFCDDLWGHFDICIEYYNNGNIPAYGICMDTHEGMEAACNPV